MRQSSTSPILYTLSQLIHLLGKLFNIFVAVSFKHLDFNNVRVFTVRKLARRGRHYIYSKLALRVSGARHKSSQHDPARFSLRAANFHVVRRKSFLISGV